MNEKQQYIGTNSCITLQLMSFVGGTAHINQTSEKQLHHVHVNLLRVLQLDYHVLRDACINVWNWEETDHMLCKNMHNYSSSLQQE